MRGPKPKPTALRRLQGNPGKRAYNHDEPLAPRDMPTCPRHLSSDAKTEWKRIAAALHQMGVLTVVDRAALAAYCQAWGRWVEAERKLKETPLLLKTSSGHVQQSPYLSIANRQLELMGRFMAELGLTPASRSRVAALLPAGSDPVEKVEVVLVWQDGDGNRHERPMPDNRKGSDSRDAASRITRAEPIYLDENI
jgi:P27 family predicted phage terminase small subunit